MTEYVVDASVAIKWFVEEEDAETARRLLEDEYELSAPDLLWPECGNILWKKVQRGELTVEEARLIRAGVEWQFISLFPSNLLIETALEIALETKRTVYDCFYVTLAMLNHCQLVTADIRLVNALQGGTYAKYLIKLSDLP